MSFERVQVKICGITRVEDAVAAAEAGTDAVGLMFYEGSRRWISLQRAREVASVVPRGIARVGVFVNMDEPGIQRCIEACNLDVLQFHGDETPEFCARFPAMRIWKAFRVSGPEVLERMPAYPTDAWLLDAAVAGQLGGSGEPFDWALAVKAKVLGRPLVLAGGLSPSNVREAVERVRPFAVDVSSGVEVTAGVKDAAMMRAFVLAAKGDMSHPAR